MTAETITGVTALVLLLSIPAALVTAVHLQTRLKQQIAGGDDSVRAQIHRISAESAALRETVNRLPIGN